MMSHSRYEGCHGRADGTTCYGQKLLTPEEGSYLISTASSWKWEMAAVRGHGVVSEAGIRQGASLIGTICTGQMMGM